MEKFKSGLIKIIEEMEIKDSFKKPIIDFIRTYKGRNEKEFYELFHTIIDLLCEMRELEVKAQGYDAVKNLKGEFDATMVALKKEYNKISTGEIPQYSAFDPAGVEIED